MQAELERKIKVLYLNHASQISGAEVGLLDLVKNLNRERFTPLVILPAPGPLVELLQEKDLEILFMPLKRLKRSRNPLILLTYLFSLIKTVPRVVFLIKRKRVDILHANSNNAQIYGALAAKLAGIPSIWHSRDLVPLGFLGKILYRLSFKIIAISYAVAEHIKQYRVGANKLVTIHNAVDLEGFSVSSRGEKIREEFNIGQDKFLVGMVGQLIPWKNHTLFLQAASRVAKEFKDAFFLIVGDDLFGDNQGYRERLENLAVELELKEKLIFTGYRKDIVEVLESLDLLVLPSAREPFGRVIIEAMALSKPVVAINDGGPREIIEDGTSGLLVPPDDPQAIAEAIGRLIKDRALGQQMGEVAQERVRKLFNLREYVGKIESLYEEMAGDG